MIADHTTEKQVIALHWAGNPVGFGLGSQQDPHAPRCDSGRVLQRDQFNWG